MSDIVKDWVIETESQAMQELRCTYSGALLALTTRARLYEAWAQAAILIRDGSHELVARGLSWAQTDDVERWLGGRSRRWEDDARLCRKAIERVTEARRLTLGQAQ